MAHHARQRNYGKDPYTYDLFKQTELPKGLRDEKKPVRFATVIKEHGETEESDNRANFVRYMEDFVLPAAHGTKLKSRIKAAEQTLTAYRFWEHIVYLENQLLEHINSKGDYSAYLEEHNAQMAETEAKMAEAVKKALKAFNSSKYLLDENFAMLFEIPYMALRGSKSLLIIATKRGRFYEKWADKYRHLWTLHKGPTPEALDFVESFDPYELEDVEDLNLGQYFQHLLNHSPRPMWWGDMNLGPFNRTCRRLVKITKTKRSKRLHTPAMLLHWRTRPKPSKKLGANEDYRN